MRNVVFVACVFLFLASQTANAQSEISNFHQKTTTPPRARYEIIQSELAARWTFRLDRFSGKVYQLIKTSDNKNAWERMPVEGLPEISNPNTPRFILFTSGIAARYTFLMDSLTGKTWVATTLEVNVGEGEPIKLNTWKPFKEMLSIDLLQPTR